jgi:DNA polymerase eta
MAGAVNKVSVEITGSRFTLRDLSQFLSSTDSYNSRLSVIAHIDCNCFFAQVERNRLGLAIEDPLVCVQWHSLIAVSYSARACGISRMDKLVDAKQKCPNLIPVHTAVFKKNNDYWEYLDNQPFPEAADHKVSLDPYRRASLKILRVLKNITKSVEKASVDEWYLNLNELIYLKLTELVPSFNIDDLNKDGALPDLTGLELEMKGLLFGYDPEVDKHITDYDDLFIALGGIITNEIREEIFDKLRYQTSCGVSNNKKMAKLLSNYRKPNEQTILLNYKISEFLQNFKLDDISSFGGKMGADLTNNIFGDQSISEIQKQFDLLSIQKAVKDEKLATKIYKIINGQFKEPVTLNKDLTKSMNSSKNLLNGKNGENFNDCRQWLKIFAIDLKQRLIEYNNELDKFNLKPKNLTVRVRPKGYGPPISASMQLKLQMDDNMHETFNAKGLELLKELEKKFTYPIVNINLTISNFETVSKEENTIYQMFKNSEGHASGVTDSNENMKYVNVGKIKESVQATTDQGNILKMFKRSNGVEESPTVVEIEDARSGLIETETAEENVIVLNEESSSVDESVSVEPLIEVNNITDPASPESEINFSDDEAIGNNEIRQVVDDNPVLSNSPTHEIVDNYLYSNNTITCVLCDSKVEDIIEHNDFHYAMELSKELNEDAALTTQQLRERPASVRSTGPANKKKGNVSRAGATKRRKTSDNQSKLPF